jgi:hypothetical protein
MLWVVGAFFVANFAALMIVVVRRGTVDQEEGCVVNEQGPIIGDNLNAMGGHAVVAGRYLAKEKVLLNRSSFISDDSLVDGTATQNQRLIVHGIKLAFLLFWLLFVFGVLSTLPSNPVAVLLMILIMSIIFFKAAAMMRKGRQDALRKLGKKVAATRRRKGA